VSASTASAERAHERRSASSSSRLSAILWGAAPAGALRVSARGGYTTTSEPRAARALCFDGVRAERAPRVRGVHEGLRDAHVAHFRPICLTARNSPRRPRALLRPARPPRGSTRGPLGAGGPSGPWGGTHTCSAAASSLGEECTSGALHAHPPARTRPRTLGCGEKRVVRAPGCAPQSH
jgi:hypothetical protein